MKEVGDGEINDPEVFWYVENKDLDYISGLIKEFIKIKNLDINKTAVLIASNLKNLDTSKFQNLNVFYEPRHFVEDLFLLSKCDTILATKSSFSSYASFIRNIPLFFFYRNVDNFTNLIKQNKPNFNLWRME